MNVSEEYIPLQTMLSIARQQPDYNHAFPILEVIMNSDAGMPLPLTSAIVSAR